MKTNYDAYANKKSPTPFVKGSAMGYADQFGELTKKPTALITGASGGIGKAFAKRLAAMGYNLILTGRRMEALQNLALELHNLYQTNFKLIRAELSCRRDVHKLINAIHKQDDIDILINNAGFGSGVNFYQNKIRSHMQMIQVHITACLMLIHAVLPQMLKRNHGIIINVSSLSAFIPAPGSSIYSATKMFMLSFSESLAMEVAGSGICIKCLCPGFTRTGFHERLQNNKTHSKRRMACWMEADKVVDICLHSLTNHKTVNIPGFLNKILKWILSLLPRRIYYQLIKSLSC